MKHKARHRLLVAVAALVACAALSVTAAGAATAQPAGHGKGKAKSTFNVLIVTELSGPYSAFGAAYRPGMFAAGRIVNDSGGILGHKVSLTFVDDQSNPVTGVTALQNALAGGKKYNVVITAITAFTQALAPVLAKQNTLALTSGSASALFRGNPYPNLFGFSANLYSQEQGIVRKMKADGVSNVGIIAANNAAGSESAELVQQYARAAGITANVVLAPTTVVDATPQLQQLQAGGAKALAVIGFSGVVGAALNARAKLAWSAPAYCDLGCAATNWATLPSNALTDVNVEEMPWYVGGTPQTKTKVYKLFNKYDAKYDKTYSLGIVVDQIGYNMLMTARAAAIKAKSIDGTAMVKALASMHSSKAVKWYVGATGFFASSPTSSYDLPHVIHTGSKDMVFVKAKPQVKGMIAGPVLTG
jgi:branched-chain amino acid transport system substrate-binding protein